MMCIGKTELDENELTIIAGLLVMSYERFPKEERPEIMELIRKISTMAKELDS